MTSSASTSTHDYSNETIFERNRLPPRAHFLPQHSVLLNGRWTARLDFDPNNLPSPILEHKGRDSGKLKPTSLDNETNTYHVPGHWQLESPHNLDPEIESETKDPPNYTNVQFPFPCDPPNVPQYNPTCTYMRFFSIQSSWGELDRLQFRVRFEGVDSAFHVWVNDSKVGYSQGSRNAAEFDVSPYLNEGENRIIVRVYKWSDASYIEDQDQWWLSGIFRDVHLLAFPRAGYIEDFSVRTILDDAYRDAKLALDVHLVSTKPSTLKVDLFDPDGRACFETRESQVEPTDSIRRSTFDIKAPLKWTAETPHLYKIRLSLWQDGSMTNNIEYPVGFRSVEIKDGLLQVNGRPILLRGVNRHDHHPKFGRAVPLDWIRQDLLLMKRNNINALRCSHYPNRPELYYMADELGLYVMDETDLECHGFYDAVARALDVPEDWDYDKRKELCFGKAAEYTSNNSSWRDAYVERARQMVYRDRNHPCIIMWSLGNEAFYGSNHQAMYDWIKETDPSRPIHYEGDAKAQSADVFSYMYPSVDRIIRLAKNDGKPFDKPIILCEYAHAMGNGPGALREYQDAFYEYPRLQGGYIWEWANHGLKVQLEDGSGSVYAYGGDFNDEPNDGTFVMDGLCNSEHQPQPGLLTFMKVIQPVSVKLHSKKLAVTNLYDFLSLDHLRARWEIVHYGDSGKREVLGHGELDLPNIQPGSTAEVECPKMGGKSPESGETWLKISFHMRDQTAWSSEGHLIGWDDFLRASEHSSTVSDPALSSSSVPHNSEHQLTVDAEKGFLADWIVQGRKYIQNNSQPLVTLWRAPTCNDTPHDAKVWHRFGIDQLTTAVRCSSVTNDSGHRKTTLHQWLSPPSLNWGYATTVTYTDLGTDGLKIHIKAKPQGLHPKTIPRFGIELPLSPALRRARWFGLGPYESYSDKKEGARIGIWERDLDRMTTPYEVPQENGNRTETRWARILDPADMSGIEVRLERCLNEPASVGEAGSVSADSRHLFDFALQKYTTAQLEAAGHPIELEQAECNILRVDVAHQGLGTGSCGPRVLEKYELKTQEFDFVVHLRPVQEKMGAGGFGKWEQVDSAPREEA